MAAEAEIVQHDLQRNQCPVCTIKLSTRQSLRRHWHRWHEDKPATDLEEYLQQYDGQGKTHVCPTCGKRFSRSNICKEHQEKAHGEQGLKRKARFSCPIPECTSSPSFYFAKDLLQHCTTSHQYHLGVQNLEFSSWEEFLSWKTTEESCTNVSYIQLTEARKVGRGDVNLTEGDDNPPAILPQAVKEEEKKEELSNDLEGSKDMMYYFACCQDGTPRQRRATSSSTCKVRAKRQSRKIDGICISRMYVRRYSTGRVSVRYISSHTNHDLTLEQARFVPHSKDIIDSISTKLKLGIPVEHILDDIREDVGKCQTRHQFTNEAQHRRIVTHQDVLNLSRKVNHLCTIRHENDVQSVHMMVNELKEEEYDPVLCYKPQGTIDPTLCQLPKKSFMLAIQTEFQKELYEQFAPIIVCIDSTHKTNSHGFNLVTALVPDDYGEGQPVAWCITDREDIHVMKLFLGRVQERCPAATVKTVMTDDDVSWSAAQQVFGQGTKQLLCRWHVDKNWRHRLMSDVQDPQHQLEIYHSLTVLMEEPEEDKFKQEMAAFIKLWGVTEPNFTQYFRKTYALQAEKWAQCFRKFEQGDTDTSMYVESFHNKLKCNPSYLNCLVNKRVDYLMTVLLRIEENMFFERQRKSLQWKRNCTEQKEASRHESGMKIPPEDIMMVDSKTWNVKSQTTNTSTDCYLVVMADQGCPVASCSLRCTQPQCNNLCRHLYSCQCYDYNNGHICMHIHAVAMQNTESKVTLTESMPAEVPCVLTAPDPVTMEKLVTDPQTQLTQIHQHLDELSSTISSTNTAVHPYLNLISSLLDKAVLTTRAAVNDESVPAYTISEAVAPGKKNEAQPSSHTTCKKSGRKRKGNELKHTSEEEREEKRHKLEGCKVSRVTNGTLSEPNPTHSPLLTLSQQLMANPPTCTHATSPGTAILPVMPLPSRKRGAVDITAVLATQIAALKRQLGLH